MLKLASFWMSYWQVNVGRWRPWAPVSRHFEQKELYGSHPGDDGKSTHRLQEHIVAVKWGREKGFSLLTLCLTQTEMLYWHFFFSTKVHLKSVRQLLIPWIQFWISENRVNVTVSVCALFHYLHNPVPRIGIDISENRGYVVTLVLILSKFTF